MSEIILRDPSLLKPGVRFKLPAGELTDYVQDEFELIKWIEFDDIPESGFTAILIKGVSTWSPADGSLVKRNWNKESFRSTGFVILSNIRVEYKRISRRAHD